MSAKNRSIVALIAVLCLTASLFVAIPTRSESAVDDPRVDVNDDGTIDMADLSISIDKFMTSRAPMNKTALLLEVQTARAHNETYSTSLETRTGYDWSWQDIPGMTVQITLETSCTLVVMFSAEAQTTTDFLELYARATVDSIAANPSTVTLTKLLDWASHSFTFYKPNVAPGTHTVRIQWSFNDEVGNVQIRARALIVTSLLQ